MYYRPFELDWSSKSIVGVEVVVGVVVAMVLSPATEIHRTKDTKFPPKYLISHGLSQSSHESEIIEQDDDDEVVVVIDGNNGFHNISRHILLSV